MVDPNRATNLQEQVRLILTTDVAPALEMDGHSLEVLDVTDGVVQLRIHGMCSGCPASVMALISGIEAELRRRVPGVEYIELVI
jgi:Fe-S cluster biogenesis protein NfuA